MTATGTGGVAGSRYLELMDGAAAPLSTAGTGRLRANAGLLEKSENGGAWSPVGAGPPGPAGPPGVTFEWNLNGTLAGYPVDATAVGLLPVDGGEAIFDTARYATAAVTIQDLRAIQRSPGASGTTLVDVVRLRAGVFFLLGTLTLGSLAAFDNVTTAPTDAALLLGDILVCRLRQIQGGSPGDLHVKVEIVP